METLKKMAIYNLTNVTQGNIAELTVGANQLAEGFIGIGIWLSLIFIVFIAVKMRTTADTKGTFAGVMFLGLVLSVLLVQIGLLASYFILASIIFTGLGVALLLVDRSST